MKKIFVFALCLLLCATPFTVFASQSRVIIDFNDSYYYDALIQEEIDVLEETAAGIAEEFSVDVVFVMDDVTLYSAAWQADSYYSQGGYSENCVLLYLNIESRDYYILTKGDCVDFVDDVDVMDGIMDDLGDDNWFAAAQGYFAACQKDIDRGYNFDFKAEFMEFLPVLLIIIAVSFGLALIIVYSEKKSMNNAVPAKNADFYVMQEAIDICERREQYLTTTLTRVPISSGSRGGRSGGGGVRTGGHGGKF